MQRDETVNQRATTTTAMTDAYNLFAQQESYPEHSAIFSPSSMDLPISPETFATYSHSEQDLYRNITSTSIPNYVLSSHGSPGLYPDDGDLRRSPAGLSASATSAPSSSAGSPPSNHGQFMPAVADWNGAQQPLTLQLGQEIMSDYPTFSGANMDDLAAFDFTANTKTFVDPALIQHEMNHNSMVMSPYDTTFHNHLHAYPVPSSTATSPHARSSASPYMQNPAYHTGYGQAKSPFGTPMDLRRTSFAPSMTSPNGEYQSGDEAKERQRCTYPDCGKYFKDLKAHILTHQTERPEKCPIQTCEYHTKGFARKYDKNRHTLTHYKGTMVCGFCPGSGSAAEKSFNRADVFKRHLTTVHGVEQTPPNSRKKAPAAVNPGKKLAGYPSDATGKCSTCSQTFSNAQDFYEHLDDCVLRIVQQEDPAEAINAQRLAEVEHDASVAQTLEKNHLPLDTQTIDEALGEDDDMDFDYGEDGDDSKRRGGSMQKRSSGAVTKTRGRKNRRDYPSSWGFDKGQMKMKKRIMAVFDGKQRLAKDDMMLSTDHEVRIKLSDGKSYVTDLDVQTMKRAEGFLQPEDERGAWVADDPTEEQLKEMQRMLETGITE